MRRPAGFTLVELATVIAIVGLTIAILVPVVARARAAAKTIACAGNLRQIGQLAHTWSITHEGSLPLAGDLVLKDFRGTGIPLHVALSDPARRKYSYGPGPNQWQHDGETPVPFDVALLAFALGVDPTPWRIGFDWEAQVTNRLKLSALFRCPSSVRARESISPNLWGGSYSGILQLDQIGYYLPWGTDFDYALNGGLLGFNATTAGRSPRAMRGRIATARDPSALVVMGDTHSFGRVWQPTVAASAPATLADVLARNPQQLEGFAPRPAPPLYYAQFEPDVRIHGRAVNVLFLDGRVESIALTPSAAKRCRLTD